MRRFITVLVLAATALPAIGNIHPAAAAAWRLYHNTTYGYSVSYPGDWQHFSAQGTNLAIRTADTGAVFDALAEGNQSTPSAADLRKIVDSILSSAGAMSTTKVSYATILVHSVQLTSGTAKITRLNGQAITFTGFVGFRAHTDYVFATAQVTAVNGTPRSVAPAQARALARIVASITITGPAGG